MVVFDLLIDKEASMMKYLCLMYYYAEYMFKTRVCFEY